MPRSIPPTSVSSRGKKGWFCKRAVFDFGTVIPVFASVVPVIGPVVPGFGTVVAFFLVPSFRLFGALVRDSPKGARAKGA